MSVDPRVAQGNPLATWLRLSGPLCRAVSLTKHTDVFLEIAFISPFFRHKCHIIQNVSSSNLWYTFKILWR